MADTDLGRLKIPQRSRSFSNGNIHIRRKEGPHDKFNQRPIPRPPNNDSIKRRRSESIGKSSSNNSISIESKASKSSILTPRFMPWAFNNTVKSRLLPADVEDRISSISLSNHSHEIQRENHRYQSDDERPISHKKEYGKHDNAGRRGTAVVKNCQQIKNVCSHPIARQSSHTGGLKYNKQCDINDMSTSTGSHSDYNTSYRWEEESKELRMDTIYGEYSAASKETMQAETPTAKNHNRSRSLDFADHLRENEEPLYPSLLQNSDKMLKSPSRYGAADFADPFKGDYESEEFSPFLVKQTSMKSRRTLISTLDPDNDSLDAYMDRNPRKKRSMRRRLYLLITDPTSSILSAICTLLIYLMIICSNVVLVFQTLDTFEYTPESCHFCDQYFSHQLTDDPESSRTLSEFQGLECLCPPQPLPLVDLSEDWIMSFFTVEWILRLVCFDPILDDGEDPRNPVQSVFDFFLEPHSLMDLGAFLPYYLEKYAANHSFMSFRLLRVFRVFQLIRLGQYDATFCALVNVIGACLPSISMLGIAIAFGGSFFGTIVFWLEKGQWKYTELLDPPGFAHVRFGSDGLTEELSPFRSIPGTFWWFIVTVTTVGYGK